MHIFVRIGDGDIILFPIEPTDTVEHVIQAIITHKQLPPKNYILYVDGIKLDDTKTLVDYNIPNRQARYITTVDELYTKNGLCQFDFMRSHLLSLFEPSN